MGLMLHEDIIARYMHTREVTRAWQCCCSSLEMPSVAEGLQWRPLDRFEGWRGTIKDTDVEPLESYVS